MTDRLGGVLRCKAVVVFSFEGNKNCIRIERMNPCSTPSSLGHLGALTAKKSRLFTPRLVLRV